MKGMVFFLTVAILIINLINGTSENVYLWTLFVLPIAMIIVKEKRVPTLLYIIVYESYKFIVECILFGGRIPSNLFYQLLQVTLINGMIYLLIFYIKMEYSDKIKEMENLTLIDPLTESYNRRYYNLYKNEMNTILKNKGNITLALIDIDHFKFVNDKYGHVFGDRVLKNIVSIIKDNVRETDKIVRMGGEEFCIILPFTTLDSGIEIVERIREKIEKKEFIHENKKVHITISIGVTMIQDSTFDQYIEQADNALYEAKQRGRNQVVQG